MDEAPSLTLTNWPVIPVKSVYFLLCYAWDVLPEAGFADVQQTEWNELSELLAFVLCSGVESLARRGLERDYQELEEELSVVRGRPEFLASYSRLLPQRGRLLCTTDDLSANTAANQIVKSTLGKLERVSDLDKEIKGRIHGIRKQLRQVDDVHVDAMAFRRVRLHGNNRQYRFLLDVCRLIHDARLAEEGDGRCRFRDFLRDDRRMARLFQRFVCNFYRLERKDATIHGERISWACTGSPEDLKLLPAMETDISMRVGDVKLIIDTKYYREALVSRFDKMTVNSGHLYQLLAYLSNASKGGCSALEGMLLYPTVSQRLRLHYDELQGFRVRVCSVDLNQKWQMIRDELHALAASVEKHQIAA
jgi:5-methylcytosine-specific restriction enzyme subunit McrC